MHSGDVGMFFKVTRRPIFPAEMDVESVVFVES